MALGFGWKARIGQLYPSGGLCDYETQVMAPAGVQFLTTRLAFRRTGLEDDRAMVEGVERHARLLADAEVDLIAFNCTAAAMLVGADQINRRIGAATGIRSVTTIDAVLAALDAARLRRIALMTPYPQAVVDAETAFLQARGIAVTAHAGIACDDPIAQGTIAPERWRDLARSLHGSDCDGLLVSCAGIQLAPVLGQIEREFGRPVIASNQALVWHCLRVLGLAERSADYGRLLAGDLDPLRPPR